MKSGNISIKTILTPLLSFLIPLTPQFAFTQGKPELRLESVVIVSRHDVCALTKATQLVQDATLDAWSAWPVKPGWPTPHGGELIVYPEHYQRQRLAADGLPAKKSCSRSGRVAIIADTDECTHKIGEALAAGLAPNCVIVIHTQADTSSPDPLSSPLKTGVCQLDSANVADAILSKAEGSVVDFTGHRQAALHELKRVLNLLQSNLCFKREKQDESCSLTQVLPSELKVNADNVSLTDTISLTLMLTEISLLQQAQGMSESGWGRIIDSH